MDNRVYGVVPGALVHKKSTVSPATRHLEALEPPEEEYHDADLTNG